MDEMVLMIRGQKQYLWRAVDQDGNVLDILVQNRRNKKAAKRFFRKLLKGLQYVPRVIITDKLRSYGAAKQAQRFLSAFGPISGHFQLRRHHLSAGEYRAILQRRFEIWNEVIRVKEAS
jgi:putative transposase